MKIVKKWCDFSIVIFATLSAMHFGIGQVQSVFAGDITLEPVLKRVRAHASSEDWRKEGWKDEQIDAWLDKLTTPIIQAAGLPALKIPIRFSDVQAADPAPLIESGLLVGKSMKLGTVRRSIVLCDGDFEADRVEDSVVIARRCVFILNSYGAERSVIVAGTYISIVSSGKRGSDADGNIVVSRGWADISETDGSAFFAPEGISTFFPEGNAFINADIKASVSPHYREGNRSVRVPDLVLGPVPFHPMSPKLELIGVVDCRAAAAAIDANPNPDLERTGLAFRYAGRRCVAMRGQPIVDEAGTPLPIFDGWRLTYILDPYIAVFDTDAAAGIIRILDPSNEL